MSYYERNPIEKEFPGFELGVTIPHVWVDTSWHQDACPSFIHGDRKVFVDFAREEDREISDQTRFAVVEIDEDGIFVVDVYNGDDWQKVLEAMGS